MTIIDNTKSWFSKKKRQIKSDWTKKELMNELESKDIEIELLEEEISGLKSTVEARNERIAKLESEVRIQEMEIQLLTAVNERNHHRVVAESKIEREDNNARRQT